MKIAHISPSYYPAFRYGGPTQSVHLLNAALVRKGIDVSVYTTTAGLESTADTPVGRWTSIDGVKVIYFNYYGYEHYTFSPELFRSLLKDAHTYDLFHITAVWNFPVFAASMSALIKKKPYLISTRGVLCEEALQLRSRFKKLILYNMLAKHYLNRASGLHFTSEDEKEKVPPYLGLTAPAYIVPNGIDITEFTTLPQRGIFTAKYPKLKDKRFILFLGRINKVKGLDILIDAFAMLQDKDLFLVLAGPDNEGYGKILRDKLQNLGLLDKVIMPGSLKGEDKLSAYVDAAVFVLPSYSESFGMSVVEAMACGTPCVVSDKVGIHTEIARHNAGKIVSTTSQSIYNGIDEVLRDTNLAKALASNGKALVKEQWDVAEAANKMINIYNILIGHK